MIVLWADFTNLEDILGASIDLGNRGNVVDYTRGSYPQPLLSLP